MTRSVAIRPNCHSRNRTASSLALAALSLLTACDLEPPQCEIQYSVTDEWGGGFRASITLENRSDTPLEDWQLRFPTPPLQEILSVENAELVPSESGTILAAPPEATIPAGDSAQIYFASKYAGERRTPSEFRIDGKLCVGGKLKPYSLTNAAGQMFDILVSGSPSANLPAPGESWLFSGASETVRAGFVEVQGGLARFFVEDAPWSDLEVVSRDTSRLVRMRRVQGRNEYVIFGLTPGDSIRYRFLVGLSGQVWTDWHDAIYSGLDGETAGPSTPKVEELTNGELRFSLSGPPWAEVHTQIGDDFLARRLVAEGESQALVIVGLQSGDRIDYRWVVGTMEVPGQYDTDWSSYIYFGNTTEISLDNLPPIGNAAAPDAPVLDMPVAESSEPDLPPNNNSNSGTEGASVPLPAAPPASPIAEEAVDSPPNDDSEFSTDPASGSGDLHRFEADTLYLIGEASEGEAGMLVFDPGVSGDFDRVPGGRVPISYEAHGLEGTYDPDEGEETAFELWIDGWLTGVSYLEARILYDFDGDGAIDREEVFTAAPAHALRGLDRYDSETFPLVSSTGDYRDLNGGSVFLELTNPHGTQGPDLFTDAAPRELTRSFIEIPFDMNRIETRRPQTEYAVVEFPEGLLCPLLGNDPRCGAGFDPSNAMSESQLEFDLERGQQAFRATSSRGACAGCHVPDAFDIAIIGYSDEDIRRRALDHVSESQAEDIIALVHALRQEHTLTRLLHPARFRPLQPGYEPLPGATPQDRDLAFLEFLRDEVNLLLVTDVIDSRSKALAAEQQLLALDLDRLRIGVRLDRWSEDQFHGLSHVGQDPLDESASVGQGGSVAEWLPNMASSPTDEQAFYGLFDQYAADPTDRNFWRFYDSIRDLTLSHESISEEAGERAFEWMHTKYEAIQVLGHMLRRGTMEFPDRAIDQREHDLIANREVSIARNPIWRVGDLIRQRPLHCNHPDGCTEFPDFVVNETDEGKLELQSRILERAWFWAGWMIDPSLLTSDESFETVSGDYFYPLHQGHWGGHYAFIVAKMATEKANASGWEKAVAPGTSGHGKWASIRPFLVYKHSEFQRPMFGLSDPRHTLQKQLLTNAARMWIYLVHDDLERTGTAFDREGTAKAVNFARLNWLESVDPGGVRADIEPVFDEIISMLNDAQELRQQHHTDDLYDYLPVADVPLD